MTPLELQAAGGPAGAGAAQGDARERGGQTWRNAWQKEMENLQAGAWLGHGLVAGQRGDVSAQAAARGTAQGQAPRARHEQEQLQAAARQPYDRTADATQHRMPAQAVRAGIVQWLSATREPVFENDAMAAATGAMAAVVAAAVPAATVLATARWSAPVPCAEPRPPVAASPFAARAASTAATPDESAGIAQGQAARPPAPPSSPADRQAVRFHAEWSTLGVRLWLGMDAQGAAAAGLLVAQLQRSIAAAGSRLLSLTCNGQDMPLASGAAAPAAFPSPPFAEKMETKPWQSTQ